MPFLVPGPVMLTDYREDACYEQFAEWLFSRVKRIKKVDSLGTLRLITDDEPALYNPFLRTFQTVHGLCYIHLEDSFVRYDFLKIDLSHIYFIFK